MRKWGFGGLWVICVLSLGGVCGGRFAHGKALKQAQKASSSQGLRGSKEGPFGGEPLLIGVVIPSSGNVPDYGEMSKRGVEMALASLPPDESSQVKVFYQDSKNVFQEASTAMQTLISTHNVRVVVGDVGSKTSIAMAQIAEKEKVPMVSPGATIDDFTQNKKNVFRICFSNSFQGHAMATYAYETLKARVAGIFYDNSDYGSGLNAAIKKRFTELGGKILLELPYNASDIDFLSPLRKFRKLPLDTIFLPGYYQQTGLIVRQSFELNHRNKKGGPLKFMGSDGWASPVFFKLAGPKASPGHHWVNHYSSDDKAPHIVKFVEAYKKKYKESQPPVLVALYYDALRLVVQAARSAKSPSRADLSTSIASTKDFQGVTGAITIGPDHDAKKSITVLETTQSGYLFKGKLQP